MSRKILLARNPVGMPQESDFAIVTEPDPVPSEGEILLATRYITVDPYLRGRIRYQPNPNSYIGPILAGNPMEGGLVAEVVESKNPKFSNGEFVFANTYWADLFTHNGEGLRKLNPSLAPVTTALGILGVTGLTAYFGLIDIGEPKTGETFVVSGAAGAVGMAAGQIAKINGCRVIGIASSEEKCRWLKEELGFDHVISYRTEDVPAKLDDYCPNGVDIYFDNVGGEISDAVLMRITKHARIVMCGAISQYNMEKPEMGPRLLFQLIVRSAKMQGFIVSDYMKRWPEAIMQMAQWLATGQLKNREEIVEGFENTPKAFISLFSGANTGKLLVKC